ncbi:MAG: immunoglobulin-like domain-containing protein [Clostridium sp.]
MRVSKLKKYISLVVMTAVMISCGSTLHIKKAAASTEMYKNFGVGQGIKWPDQVNAPFVDMTAYVKDPAYSNNGVTNLGQLVDDTGTKFYNLGFIQSTGGVVDGKIKWGWGGQPVITEDTIDPWQHDGIKKAIRDVRAKGGDVAISLGGLTGTSFWQVTQDVDVLVNTYLEIINGYGLTRVDLDIEGPQALDKERNRVNAKAIKKVQELTGVEVVITLAVMPEGLTRFELDALEMYITEGVKISSVNIMTMCYGQGAVKPGENYGQASVRAIESTKNQLKDYYKRFGGVELTDAEAYRKISTTTSIGFESEAHPIFTTDMAKLVVDYSIEKGLSMTSFWSMNRDAMIQPNSGIKNKYEFNTIYKTFPSGNNGGGTTPEVNTKPIINGAVNKTINLGDSFNPLAGIIAYDKEDGDLTDKIVIDGKVDTSIATTYRVVYSVTDSKGLKTSVEVIITVKDNTQLEDTYDPNKVYGTGDVVIYKGVKYRAKWWIQGGEPGVNPAWEIVVTQNPDGSVDYIKGSSYEGGALVRYNGKTYKANWWTSAVPGSDSSWTLVG